MLHIPPAYAQIDSIAGGIAAQLHTRLSRAASCCPPTDPALPPLVPSPVVGILCPSGQDFFTHAVAVWYLGSALLPIAIGTTEEGIRNLLGKTGACALIVHDSQKDLADKSVKGLRDGFEVVGITGRSVLETSPEQPSFDPALRLAPISPDHSMIIFHSSGSTGLPKPIYHIHRFWTFSLEAAQGTDVAAYTTTPLYHGGMSDFLRSLQAGSSIFFHPITGVANTLSVEHILAGYEACQVVSNKCQIRYFLSVPFVLEMLSKSEQALTWLAKMDLVSTGGAPLPEQVGSALVDAGVHLVSRLGSSECGFLMSSFRDFAVDKEWSWLRIDDSLAQDWIEFREDKDNAGLFELIVTGKWPAKLLSNASGNAFSTQDLYSRHPQHPTWYRYATRVDDTLVLLNGKKFAAGLIETKLRLNSAVEDAVVFGSNRALVGAIVIPPTEVQDTVTTAGDKYTYLQKLAPHLRELNSSLPSHAKLTPELIIVADRELNDSIPRSSKGTLQRGHAYRQLNDLFDGLYRDYEEGAIEGFPKKARLEGTSLRATLSHLVASALGIKDIQPTLDFYRAGMDSISAVRIKAGVHQNVDLGTDPEGHGRKLSTSDVYENPNVEALAAFIERTRKGTDASQPASASKQMTAMVSKYAELLPNFKRRATTSPHHSHSVILTGATGALGAHLLDILSKDRSIDRVICLVRATSDRKAAERVRGSLAARKLRCAGWDRVACFAAELSRDEGAMDGRMGLSRQFWDTIGAASQLSVIHAAWTVNFALSLSSFEADNIRGLCNLLSLSLQEGVTSFIFCSSLASVLGSSAEAIREEASPDPMTAGSIGYSQSKWVAEALCSSCDPEVGMKVARIGQLCSDTQNGVWNETEAWPLLIRTGTRNEIGVLPHIKQPVDWLPVDVAAQTLVEVMRDTRPTATFYHICLPVDVRSDVPSWDHLLTWLSESRSSDDEFSSVTLSQWLSELRQNASAIRGRSLIEGIWSNLKSSDGGLRQVVETQVARRASHSLANAPSMDEALTRKTLAHWRETGFL